VTRDELLALCQSLPGAYLDMPWEDDEVAKVGGKIFCFLSSPDQPVSITVKNTAEGVSEWRDRFPEHVRVPRYLAKHLWNAVRLDDETGPDDDDARMLVEESYTLVVASLPKSKRPSA
jgi:predicted DNA-binding protein (MmcQ/YjbR family)